MKSPRLLIRKKKLRASTARRSLAAADEMDYEEMSEPNMKLSRALLIVLVLHVVAVAGIIAFNTIKIRQGAFPPRRPAVRTEPAQPAAPKPEPAASTVANETAPARREEAKPAFVSASKPPVKDDRIADAKIPKAMPVESPSGSFYTVAAGDNPVKIAKKLKVSESDLLAVNHIDDPRKLQIGQKLIVPASKKAKGKTEGN